MGVKLCIELDEETYKALTEIVEAGNRKFNDNMTLENLISLILKAIALNKHSIIDVIERREPPPIHAG